MTEETPIESRNNAPGPKRPREADAIAEIARVVIAAGEKLGKLTLANVTTVFALAALVFYVVGLFRRMAQLHDVGVPIGRGVPLLPLQDYLISGLAVIVNPYNLPTLLWIALLASVVLGLPTGAAVLSQFRGNSDEGKPSSRSQAPIVQGAPPTSGPRENAGASDKEDRDGGSHAAKDTTLLGRAFGWLILAIIVSFPIGVVLLIPVATWAPLVAFPVVVIVLLLLNARYGAVPLLTPQRWSKLHARVVASVFLVALSALGALVVWFNPPPLDKVTIRRVQDSAVTGPLVAQANGVVYVAGGRNNTDEAADVIAVPLGRIASIRITDGVRPYRKTVPELLGIRFWRAEQDSDGNWHLERTSTGGSLWDQLGL